VLGEQATGLEGVVDPVAEGVAQLGLGHPAVQGEGGDQDDVVDAGGGGEIEDGLDHPLTDVGTAHLRQRQADVVEGDGELHPRLEQRRQRVVVERVQQGVADRPVDVVDRVERLGRVDHPAAVGGELFEAEPLAPPEQGGRGRAVDLEDESRAGHVNGLPLRSPATPHTACAVAGRSLAGARSLASSECSSIEDRRRP
jgi:hypothetical protein